MTEATSAADVTPSPFAGGDWFDPLEEAVRLQVRGFIEELLEEELEAALGRGRYERSSAGKGHRHGRRTRQLVTTFGPLELSVPRGRLRDATGERDMRRARRRAWQRTLMSAWDDVRHEARSSPARTIVRLILDGDPLGL